MSVSKKNPNKSRSEKRNRKPISKESTSQIQQDTGLEGVQRAQLTPDLLTPTDVKRLQRTVGNRAIRHILARNRRSSTIQPSLRVNSAGDQYEQEADRVAKKVVSMPVEGRQETGKISVGGNIQAKPLAASISRLVQADSPTSVHGAKNSDEEETPEGAKSVSTGQRSVQDGIQASIQRARNSDEEETPEGAKSAYIGQKSAQDGIQAEFQGAINSGQEETREGTEQAERTSAGQGFETTSDFEDRVSATRGSGSQLPEPVRSFMEARFDSDFSEVRAHSDSNAVQLNREISARAFTQGADIFYGPGQAPANDELTAHELTHVVQQTGPVQRKKKPEQPAPNLLAGIAPLSRVMGHLQSKQRSSNGQGTSYYRKKIAEFKRTHSPEEIIQKQEQLLPRAKTDIKQTGDRSQIFRACGESEAAGKITHATKFNAPDGSANTRKKVGVGEEVKFTAPANGKWKASKGTPNLANNTNEFNWTAPNRAGSSMISYEADGKQSRVFMRVIEPYRITATKINDMAYTAGQHGAGMKLRFNYYPMTVSFGNVEAKEVSHAATGISGYYKSHGAHWHNTGDTFFPIAADNKDTAIDTAAQSGYPKPWSKGSFHWHIPNKFKVKTEAGDGKEFTKVTQSFYMLGSSGTSRVTKGGASVERTP